MIINSAKIFFRSIRHRKAVTLINLTGLVLGITSTILILQYVFYERSFDSYHKNADQICRVVYNRYRGETLLWKTANSFFPTGNYLKTNFAEVKDYFNLTRNYNIEVSVTDATGGKVSFFEEKSYYASTSIFSILDLPLIKGAVGCLAEPNTIALSEKAANKYFKGQDPIGKVMKVNNRDIYTVTGVYRDIPSNSHIKSDLFFSFTTILARSPAIINNWSSDYFHTYIKLAEGVNIKEFEDKAFPRMVNDNYKDLQARNNERDDFYLQPITTIHLNSAIEYETEPPGNGKGVSILLGFAIFFLIIAWVNYVNLVTACSIERAKEVGIRKVNGSSKKELIYQFVTEAFIFNTICLLISILLILILSPFFRQLTGIESIGQIIGFRFWIYAFIFLISGILISSIYPAFVLSSYRPAEVLKGKFVNFGHGFMLRKVLVAFQLFVSLSLLIGTSIIYKQANFLMEKDLGYNYNSTIVLKAPRTNEEQQTYQNKIDLFRNNLKQIPQVSGFTFVSDIPGQEINNWFSCYKKGADRSTGNAYFRTDIDPQFIDFFRIKILAGRNFNEDDKPDQSKLIMNIKAIKRVGFNSPEEAIGQVVMRGASSQAEIIGVVDDFNYYSVKVDAVPTIFTPADNKKQYIAIKYRGTSDIQSIINKIKPEYSAVFPDNAFEYLMMEDKMANDIKPDRTFALVFGIFSALAFIIGIIGIVGLVITKINQNVKELGIRKVLGAELRTINSLLWKQLYWELIVAVAIGIPVSCYGFQNWVLENYIYHVSINMEQVIYPVLAIVVVLAIVIILLAKRAYSTNVIEILKSE